jgi:3-phenylpropionate/trans-cinnamate dioxygenase ferredoxin subunit
MQYVKVAQIHDVKDGEKKRISFNERTVLLANVGGTYYAIDDRCPHMGASLSEGTLSGFGIACPRHGTTFDIRNGKVIQNGKLAFLNLHVKDAQAYAVKVEGDDVFIGLE